MTHNVLISKHLYEVFAELIKGLDSRLRGNDKQFSLCATIYWVPSHAVPDTSGNDKQFSLCATIYWVPSHAVPDTSGNDKQFSLCATIFYYITKLRCDTTALGD